MYKSKKKVFSSVSAMLLLLSSNFPTFANPSHSGEDLEGDDAPPPVTLIEKTTAFANPSHSGEDLEGDDASPPVTLIEKTTASVDDHLPEKESKNVNPYAVGGPVLVPSLISNRGFACDPAFKNLNKFLGWRFGFSTEFTILKGMISRNNSIQLSTKINEAINNGNIFRLPNGLLVDAAGIILRECWISDDYDVKQKVTVCIVDSDNKFNGVEIPLHPFLLSSNAKEEGYFATSSPYITKKSERIVFVDGSNQEKSKEHYNKVIKEIKKFNVYFSPNIEGSIAGPFSDINLFIPCLDRVQKEIDASLHDTGDFTYITGFCSKYESDEIGSNGNALLILGLPSEGKVTLAVNYANEYQKNEESIFSYFLPHRTKDSILSEKKEKFENTIKIKNLLTSVNKPNVASKPAVILHNDENSIKESNDKVKKYTSYNLNNFSNSKIYSPSKNNSPAPASNSSKSSTGMFLPITVASLSILGFSATNFAANKNLNAAPLVRKGRK